MVNQCYDFLFLFLYSFFVKRYKFSLRFVYLQFFIFNDNTLNTVENPVIFTVLAYDIYIYPSKLRKEFKTCFMLRLYPGYKVFFNIKTV